MSSNSSTDSVEVYCFSATVSALVSVVFNLTRLVFLFPLSTFILYLGYQRWRQQQQRSVQMMSHSDIFTFHVAVVELIWALGTCLYVCAYYSKLPNLEITGFGLATVVFFGETVFNVLACVERYLAVVHPITYRGLKAVRGIRIRNITCVCAWLLCCIWCYVATLYYPYVPTIPFFFLLVFSLAVISFCSVSVLFTLIRQGPGEGGRDRQHADQTKQRAFYTVMAITVVQWLWFLSALVPVALDKSPLVHRSVSCIAQFSAYWFSLPCSLVLPLLYLHKTRKLPFCT